MMKWECEDCGYKLVDSPLITFAECPKCGSENIIHGGTIKDDWERFNIYDED